MIWPRKCFFAVNSVCSLTIACFMSVLCSVFVCKKIIVLCIRLLNYDRILWVMQYCVNTSTTFYCSSSRDGTA